MSDRASPILLATSDLGDTRHVCAFFRSDDEEYDVLLPFIKQGLDQGEKAIHVVDEDRREDHLRRLEAAGIDTAAATARRQFELRGSVDTYLQQGRFDQDRMLARFEQWADDGVAGPFPRSRIICRMDWASEGGSLVNDVIEFESRVNDLWRRYDDVVVCTYRLDRIRGDDVIDMMRTHPVVIIGSLLQRNPFYVPPERFIQVLRARRTENAATA